METFSRETYLHPWFVTGFVDGEGSFTYSRAGRQLGLYFAIKLTDEDRPILEAIQAFFDGAGKIYTVVARAPRQFSGYTKIAAYYRITRNRDLLKVVAHFDQYPLQTTKRKALGRGLNSLLPAIPAVSGQPEKHYIELPLDQIVPNKYQPRHYFDPEGLNELAQSIKSNGVVQPVIVRKSGNHYQLIAGERRWRAAELAGLKTVPAVVRDVSEYKTVELALIENIQRQDLNPIEEATAYATLIDDFHLTQEEVAQRVGKDRSSVANYIRLLKLPEEIKERIRKMELSMGHARALSSLEKPKDQVEMATRVVEEQLNVRQIEDLIRQWKKEGKKPAATSKEAPKPDPNVRAAEQTLQERLGTRVAIQQQESGKGRIEIHFQNTDDLIRIYDLMTGGSSS